MSISFTKISKFHHENAQLLQHSIKFAVVDSSTTTDCTTELTIKATGRIFIGAWFKHAPELQNDKKIASLLTKKYFYLVTFTAFSMVKLKTADDHLMFGLLIRPLP